MVRNYKRKTDRANWSEDQMKLAISAVQKKEMSLRQAAAAYSVPKDSLNRRVKGKLKSLSEEEIHKNVLGRYRASTSQNWLIMLQLGPLVGVLPMAGSILEYLKHFVAHTKCSKGSPVLLILDGHKTHTKSVASIDYAHDNGVVLLSLPPHTSHKLQHWTEAFLSH